jgi:5-methylcytosine-specific restriction endonuclease McrA
METSDDTTRWKEIFAQIEDVLAPSMALDPFERTLYYHLLRHTRLAGTPSAKFSVAALAAALPISDFKVREVLRALHRKGCIRIEDRSRTGHLVGVLLPAEIPGLTGTLKESPPIDLASLDFFVGRRYLSALVSRQDGVCFYCLKNLDETSCELDHLVPQVEVLDNSYRNIVVACHGCNKAKGDFPAPDFIRQLYRRGVLTADELAGRLVALDAVRSGQSVPEIGSTEGASG